MNIGRKDLYWNYLATFLRIASAALLLPILLKKMPTEMVGIWTVFTSIYSFVILLDFGFNPSFTRNVTYVFSGVKNLQTIGFEQANLNEEVNYSLLKELIKSMKYFYSRIAIIACLLLLTIGTYYIHTLLKSYQGSHSEIYIAWVLLSIINCYTLYTFYYDSLIQGKGMVMRDKKINVIGQLVYLSLAAILIYFDFKLLAIVIAQVVSVVIMRILLYQSFFTKDMRLNLDNANTLHNQNILKKIYPNAVKIGLTAVGGILVTKSSLIIGSLYLSLVEIASYGITMQLISVISGISTIYIATFQPKIVNFRVQNDNKAIRNIYNKALLIMLGTYIVGGIGLIVIGPKILQFINSKTQLIATPLLVLAIVGSLIETNVSMSGTILLTKNYVPFFKASIVSGISIFLGLLLCFNLFEYGLYILFLVPIIITIFYQGWKWPFEAYKDLKT